MTGPTVPSEDGFDISHYPEVVKRRDEQWGVICSACSQAEQDYVWPCREGKIHEPPPAILADPAVLRAQVAGEIEAARCALTDDIEAPLQGRMRCADDMSWAMAQARDIATAGEGSGRGDRWLGS